jgi:hypothetical protein
MDTEIIGGVMMITLIILLFIKGIISEERK